MKRLLACLFLVLGWGLVVGVNVEAKIIYCVNKNLPNLTEKDYLKLGTYSLFSINDTTTQFDNNMFECGPEKDKRFKIVTADEYKKLLNNFRQTQLLHLLQVKLINKKNKIAKKEPSQTQEVAEKQGCIEGNCKNGQGTFTWASGNKYVGEWKDGKRRGQGTFTFANGGKYVGEYKDDKRHGQGTFTWASGDKYVGEFKDGKFHGQGTKTYADGEKYVGAWKDGKPHGQGTYTYASGNKYVGEWKDGKRRGQGTFTFANVGKYVGEYKDDKRHGQGTFTWASGDKYVGEFKDGKGHGQGTHTYANGDKYVGEYKDGKYHGQGTYTYANGDKYAGEFKDNKQHGLGTYTSSNGNKYVGEHKDGKGHGQGTFTFADGEKYVGEFKDSKYHGQGTFTFANGNKYVGEFKDGKFHGQGTKTYADGRIGNGIWKNNKLVKRNNIKTQIAKTEPSQTLQVAKKVNFCKNPPTKIRWIPFISSSPCRNIAEGAAFEITAEQYVKEIIDFYGKKDVVIQSLYDDFEKYNLDSNIVRKIVKVEKTQIAKKEPSQTQGVVKKKSEQDKKKELLAKLSKLTENKKTALSTDSKKIIRKKIKIDQNNQKVEKISAWEKSVLAALEDEKDDPYCELVTEKPDVSKILKGDFKLNFCFKKSNFLKLGTYKGLNAPKIITDSIKGCKSNVCIAKKSGSEVYKLFVQKGSRYHARHPGDMIKGMVWFEIMYLDRLKKTTKKINRYNQNNYEGLWKLKKNEDARNIYSLIKMNNGRIKMREALGYTLYDDLNYVIEGQWLLAEFLNKDKLKVTKNLLTPEMKKRKILIEKYKSVLARYKTKLEEEKEKKNDKKS